MALSAVGVANVRGGQSQELLRKRLLTHHFLAGRADMG